MCVAEEHDSDDMERFEVETTLTIRGAVSIEAESASKAKSEVESMDRDELEAHLTKSSVETYGAYNLD